MAGRADMPRAAGFIFQISIRLDPALSKIARRRRGFLLRNWGGNAAHAPQCHRRLSKQ
jgi:hypothetical protein